MSTTVHPIERQDKDELQLVAIKIPRVLVALLDNAASNDWDTRNGIIRRVLEQHFEEKAKSSQAHSEAI